MRASGGRWILSETGKCLMTWWNVAKCHGAYIRTCLPPTSRGARPVWRDLLTESMSCGLHRVERLMRLEALKARARRRRLPPSLGEQQLTSPQTCSIAPSKRLLSTANGLGRSWTTGGLYVAAVSDLFSRCVVGWSMSAAMRARLVTDALMMAIWRWGKPHALLHHSDRGRQYTSEPCQRFMADHGRLLDEPVGQRLETTPRWRAPLVTQHRAHSA